MSCRMYMQDGRQLRKVVVYSTGRLRFISTCLNGRGRMMAGTASGLIVLMDCIGRYSERCDINPLSTVGDTQTRMVEFWNSLLHRGRCRGALRYRAELSTSTAQYNYLVHQARYTITPPHLVMGATGLPARRSGGGSPGRCSVSGKFTVQQLPVVTRTWFGIARERRCRIYVGNI